MSSDDSGFDKEAEREKLREKYGNENDDRENTRRMSELLLQGATMTGKHCDNCGDPIFRHDGQEFCPTCQHEARQQAQSQNAEAGEKNAKANSKNAEARSQNVEARSQNAEAGGQADADKQADDEPRVEINDVRVADRHADRSDVRRPPSQTADRRSADDSVRRGHTHGQDQHGRRDLQQGRVHDHSHDDHRADRSTPGRDAGGATGLGPAREALVRKLTDLARTAEETDDVARSRELLAATREAAEALAALDRANR